MESCYDKSSHHNLIYADTFLAPNVFPYYRCGYNWSLLIHSTSISVLHNKSTNTISSYTFFEIFDTMKPVLRRPHNKRAPCIERILESKKPLACVDGVKQRKEEEEIRGCKEQEASPHAEIHHPPSLNPVNACHASQKSPVLFFHIFCQTNRYYYRFHCRVLFVQVIA